MKTCSLWSCNACAIRLRLDCLNPKTQWRYSRSSVARLYTDVLDSDEITFGSSYVLVKERCLMKAFKDLNGEPKLR